MRILDRYIFKSVLKLFSGCLSVFFSLYIVIDIFSNLDDILKHRVAIGILMQYYLSYLPTIFVQVTPIALLLATLYTFGRLNRNNEIIAMRSAGLSIFQITKTVLIMGAIISVCVFFVTDRLIPKSLATTGRIKAAMESGKKQALPKEREVLNNLTMYGLNNRLIFASKFLAADKTMEGIIILEHDERQDITKKIVANKGVYQDGLWRFYQSITYFFDKNGQVIEDPQYSEEEIMTIPETPREFLTQRQQPDFMTIAQLKNYIWKLSNSGALTVIRNLKVDLYNRYSSALTGLIVILLGIPFALKMKRRATGLSSIGLSIMVGFLFYVMTAVSIALGKAGILPPALSASLPQIAATSVALYMINALP